MQLTSYTDYALRTLIYLALREEGGTVTQVSESFKISRNHLVKVAHHLGQLGYIQTTRGKSGGMKLAMDPAEINIGEVVRKVEPNFTLVECFREDGGECVITPACALKGALARAEMAFMGVLREYTLADVVANGDELAQLLDLPASGVR